MRKGFLQSKLCSSMSRRFDPEGEAAPMRRNCLTTPAYTLRRHLDPSGETAPARKGLAEANSVTARSQSGAWHGPRHGSWRG